MDADDLTPTSERIEKKDKIRHIIRQFINDGATNLEDLMLEVKDIEYDTRLIGKTSEYELCAYFLEEHLGAHGEGMPLHDLPHFLQKYNLVESEDDVVAKKRSMLRHLRGDARFRLEGTNRNRFVYFSSNAQDTEAQRKGADWIIRHMLQKTMKGEFPEEGVPLSSLGWSEPDALLSSLRLLKDDYIVSQEGDYLQWTNKSFIGYEPRVKRSSALNLPERTWETVRELLLRLEESQASMPLKRGEFPILDLAFRRGPPFNNSELIELAIEHLMCTLQRLESNS